MNRRNVLGNQISESKTTWVVITGILETILLFVFYRFITIEWLTWLLMVAGILIGCGIVHALTGELIDLFAYLLIPSTFFAAMGVFRIYSSIWFLGESKSLFFISILVWLITVIYAVVCVWVRGSGSSLLFVPFYLRSTVFFYLVYFSLVVFGVFFYDKVAATDDMVQMIPFATFAAYIEAIIHEVIPWQALAYFLLYRAAFFIPYGFFVSMVCQKLHVAVRILILLILPGLIEIVQLLFRLNRCDIDELIFAFIGGLIGMLCFCVFNELFIHFTGKMYDGKEPDRDYYGRRLRY